MEHPLTLQKANGNDIFNWFASGTKEVIASVRYLNAINVFPVADGDTGSNMAATLKAMVERPGQTAAFNQMIEEISKCGLSGARGNSGTIFASYISGLAAEAKAYEAVDIEEFSNIAYKATEQMYRAVETPMEGTLISVIRDWAAHMVRTCKQHKSFQTLFHDAYQAAAASLEKTKEQLAILKKTNLVDSGAAGFVRFLKGMNQFFSSAIHQKQWDQDMDLAMPIVENSESSQYRFCTEALVELSEENGPYIDHIRAMLKPLGDSLIVAGDKLLKVHIHTDHPELVMERLHTFGTITYQKADDMHLQESLKRGVKGSIGLITDSIADLPEDIKLHYQNATLPLGVLIGQEIYLDKRTISLNQLFLKMEKEEDYPTTSQAEPERVSSLISDMLDRFDSLIILSVSSHMSGTYQGYQKAAQALSDKGKQISIIDTKLNSGAQGLLVKQAAQFIEAGYTHDQVVSGIKGMIPKTKIYVCLNTLAYAVRGGRVPNTIGRLGMKIGLRPIMTIDANGKGTAFGASLSQRGLTNKIMKLAERTIKDKGIAAYSIVHGGNLALAEEYAAHLTRLTGFRPDFVSEISSAVAIHAGPGTVALCLVEGKEASQ